jgi:hypothetical protein
VIFSQPNMGSGLAFRDVKPYFLTVLQKWLTQAMKAKDQSGGRPASVP